MDVDSLIKLSSILMFIKSCCLLSSPFSSHVEEWCNDQASCPIIMTSQLAGDGSIINLVRSLVSIIAYQESCIC